MRCPPRKELVSTTQGRWAQGQPMPLGEMAKRRDDVNQRLTTMKEPKLMEEEAFGARL